MAYVALHYGPYSCNGTVKHRTSRLMNLVRYLQEKGNEVGLRPTINWDTLEVLVSARVAFRCRLTFLSQLDYRVFGKDHDPVFVRAIEAIEETLSRVGRTVPNIRVPGLYKEMFNVPLDFGSGIVHNNDPAIMEDLEVDDQDSSESEYDEDELNDKFAFEKQFEMLN